MVKRPKPQPAIRGVLFDWNGTLLADLAHAYAGWMACFDLLGVRRISLARFRRTYRLPWQAFYRDHGVGAARRRPLERQLDATYRARQRGARLTPGVPALVRWLQRRGVVLGILSDDPRREIVTRLRRARLQQHFAFIGTSERYAPKPSPAGVRAFLRRTRLTPREVVMVGDLADDIRAGRAARVRTAAYLGGWQDSAVLRRSRPDQTLRRLPDLRALMTARGGKV